MELSSLSSAYSEERQHAGTCAIFNCKQTLRYFLKTVDRTRLQIQNIFLSNNTTYFTSKTILNINVALFGKTAFQSKKQNNITTHKCFHIYAFFSKYLHFPTLTYYLTVFVIYK